jgi:hypothetical protein
MKHYCINCKIKEISLANYLYGKHRCRKCASQKRKGIVINIGNNNGNFKDGKSTYQHFCKDCKKKIFYKAIRCKACAQKLKGTPHTELTKKKLSKAHMGKTISLQTIKKIKKTPHKHHIDLNKKNNKESNILILSNSHHGRLHRLGYHYLVKIGLIKQYIKWYIKNYFKNESI